MVDFLAPEQYVADADGRVPPKFGGALAVAESGAIVFGDDGNAINIWLMPPGTELVALIVLVTTAFNDSGTDLLDLGNTGSGTAYATDLVVSAVGTQVIAIDPTTGPLDEETYLTAQYDGQNSDSSAGALAVIPIYCRLGN